MVNTRAKIKKTQDSTLKACFSQESDNDESTQSGALIGSNDDLLNEILGRLPAKSILRFKSVSKHWLSLLTHPRFTLLFDKLLNSPGLFVGKLYVPFDVENQSPPPFRNLDFFPDPYGIKIVQSCNGLLLCCSKKGPAHLRKYYVFNPTNKQFAVIPSVGKAVSFMGLAYHPTDCVHFKLLCIHHPDHPDPGDFLFELLIYSSHTKEWKFILSQSFFAPWDTPFTYPHGVYWNQAFHWAPCTLDSLYFKLDEEKLLPLSINSMDGTQIGDYQDGTIPTYFGESRGHLHLVEYSDDTNPLHLDVYEMLSDHSGWFVKYQVDLHELPAAYPEMIRSDQHPSSPIYYDFGILDFVRGEKEEDTFMVVCIPGKIIRYNILDKSFHQIFIMNNKIYSAMGPLNVHRYTETLTSF